MKIQKFEDLDVWQQARKYIEEKDLINLKTQAETISRSIAGFIKYLRNDKYPF